MDNTRIFRMTFASVYPHYVAKAEKKGRTKAELHAIIQWLTGYDEKALQKQIDTQVDFQTFFAQAPQINPNVSKITGVICGYRVEQIEDKRPWTRFLGSELARDLNRKLQRIRPLRASTGTLLLTSEQGPVSGEMPVQDERVAPGYPQLTRFT
jgi:hypothetical protein